MGLGSLRLDGLPRPVHLDHGQQVIDWQRDTQWVHDNPVNRIEPIAEGEGWREERTGMHEREFIETRRHWFTAPVTHHTHGGVNVLNWSKELRPLLKARAARLPRLSSTMQRPLSFQPPLGSTAFRRLAKASVNSSPRLKHGSEDKRMINVIVATHGPRRKRFSPAVVWFTENYRMFIPSR